VAPEATFRSRTRAALGARHRVSTLATMYCGRREGEGGGGRGRVGEKAGLRTKPSLNLFVTEPVCHCDKRVL